MLGLFTYGQRLNELFLDAVSFHFLHNDADSLEIAANCIATTGKSHRKEMMELLDYSVAQMASYVVENNLVPGRDISKDEAADIFMKKAGTISGLSEKMLELGLRKSRNRMKDVNRQIVERADRLRFREVYGGV